MHSHGLSDRRHVLVQESLVHFQNLRLLEGDLELKGGFGAAGFRLLQRVGGELQSGIRLLLHFEFGADLDDVLLGLDDVVDELVRLQDVKDALLVFRELRCVEQNACRDRFLFLWLSLAFALLFATSGCSLMGESDVGLAITQVLQQSGETLRLFTRGGPSLVNQEFCRLLGQVLALLKSWHQDGLPLVLAEEWDDRVQQSDQGLQDAEHGLRVNVAT